MRDFVKLLIACDAKGHNGLGRNAPAAFGKAVEKLRLPLIALTGTAGFRALLSRALARSNTEVRWLRAIHVKADGSLECPAEVAHLDQKTKASGEVVVIAHLLALLVAFIGEALTLQLVQEAWPQAPIDDFDSSKRGSRTEEK